ncbi:MAG: type II toxin-antitoxin system MqsA family antitoxin [Firmicutes bacterium]|nr:type II toxin-antitoxin system MqsA family antitoxin [Bacillota bacterium]
MCQFCKCKSMKKSVTTHVVNYKNYIITVKNVPCLECERCCEKYYDDETAEHLEKIVGSAKQLMQEKSVIDYKTAA